jgi:hypothetical protein
VHKNVSCQYTMFSAINIAKSTVVYLRLLLACRSGVPAGFMGFISPQKSNLDPQFYFYLLALGSTTVAAIQLKVKSKSKSNLAPTQAKPQLVKLLNATSTLTCHLDESS